MSEVRYIAIEGVIGAGKTSLAKKLSDQLNARLVLEQFEINPFLSKFYQDQKRFAFQTQMFFLVNRYKQQQDLFQENLFSEFLITDYVFNKDQIFAYLNLSNDEIKLYESIFPLLSRTIRQPDIVVYLQSSVDRLMANIKKRNRKIEEHISKSYIEELHNAYNKYFFKYDASPLLIVDVEEIDFVNNKKDYEDLVKEIFRQDRAKTEYYKPERKLIL
jgi:deoxyadenosine/deoxycytidine kinase